MKLPRDLSAGDLIRTLSRLGYQVTRQRASHIRLTTQQGGEHHVSLPNHDPIRVGTLSGILLDVAAHFHRTREELASELFEG